MTSKITFFITQFILYFNMCFQCHYDLLRAILRGFNTLSTKRLYPYFFNSLGALKDSPPLFLGNTHTL
nr:MAG TPA: hypothetical protein [Caudoviricetes sp.]